MSGVRVPPRPQSDVQSCTALLRGPANRKPTVLSPVPTGTPSTPPARVLRANPQRAAAALTITATTPPSADHQVPSYRDDRDTVVAHTHRSGARHGGGRRRDGALLARHDEGEGVARAGTADGAPGRGHHDRATRPGQGGAGTVARPTDRNLTGAGRRAARRPHGRRRGEAIDRGWDSRPRRRRRR